MVQSGTTPLRFVRNRKGVTLLEAVIAMGIIFVTLLALLSLAVTASKGMAASQHLTTAVTLAQDTLETLHTGTFGPLEVTDDYAAIPNFPLYKRVLRLELNHPVPGLRTATVTVWWADDRHSVSLSTILTL